MTVTPFRGSARIYEFAEYSRASELRHAEFHEPLPDPALGAPNIMWGSSWYHEAAIAEAVDTRMGDVIPLRK